MVSSKVEDSSKTSTETKGDNASAPVTVSFFQLFRFADKIDILMMVAGSIAAMAYGALQPIISVILGDVINAFLDYGRISFLRASGVPIPEPVFQASRQKVEDEVIANVLIFVWFGIGAFAMAYTTQALWTISGERQAHRVRQMFLRSILSQDVTFFDENETGDLTTRLSSDTTLFQEGISEKVGLTVAYLTTFVTGFVVAFISGWKLTLVLLACFPLLMVAGALVGKAIASGIEGSQTAYAKAGAVAQESLANIRTVTAFNGQERAAKKFDAYLDVALKVNEAKAWKTGFGFGFFFSLLFGFYALAFYYGSILAESGEMKGGDVLNVVFAIIIGAFSLINLGPSLQSINKGRGVAGKLFQVISSDPQIPTRTPGGRQIDLKGNIEFKDVVFEYPSRPGQTVLKKFNLKVKAGQTVALVGSSGSGKSTIIQLLERFYDPVEGEVLIDDVPLKQIDLEWLRSRMGLVSQEPILFDMSIEDNVRLGAIQKKSTITMADIERVCQESNAHSFIQSLPLGYKTRAGERGSLFSGGQKQRIAIARALLREPTILLCDEATSALDSQSEKVVQEALDKAAKDRTTLVIAHRLSTIKNADSIVVMDKGEVVEQGTHDELIAKNGHYFALVKAQELKKESAGESAKAEGSDGKVVSETSDHVAIRMDSDNAIKGDPEKGEGEELTEEERMKREEQAILKHHKTPLWEILKMQSKEWHYLVVGVLSSGGNGALLPIVGTLLGEVLAVFSKSGQELLDGAAYWSMVFMFLMFAQFACNLGQFGGFGVAGERLTRALRSTMFNALLRQDIGFFDDAKNGTGALTAKLSDEAEKIQGLTGPVLGNLVQLAVSVGVALGLSFYYSWQMTLVVLAIVPVMILGGILETKITFMGANDPRVRRAYSQAAQTACDAIANIRTIKSFNIDEEFVTEYGNKIELPYKVGLRRGYFGSIGFGWSQGIQFWVYAVAFYAGYRFVFADIIAPRDLFTCLFTLVFGTISFSSAAAFGPNVTKARVAAINYFLLTRRVPAIDNSSEAGDKPTDVAGNVKVDQVHFSYPQRLDVPILKGVSLSIKPGQSVALVGPSGSGKSTIVALLERFYDPLEGTVSVENKNLKEWNVRYLREQTAIVSQEPTLFIGTIADNIKYGKPEATDEEMFRAATMANIHSFIDSLPDKYQTEVSGSQLSGGQKQRVAIARAILKAPRLLLLDEPTSALDSESEKVVQNALTAASEGRTTITIAHRLSTVQNCDLIVVMQDGQVIETGTHNDLLQQRGLYFTLVEKQKLTN